MASRCDGTAQHCLEALELDLSVICLTSHTASPSDSPADGGVGRFFVSDAGTARTMVMMLMLTASIAMTHIGNVVDDDDEIEDEDEDDDDDDDDDDEMMR